MITRTSRLTVAVKASAGAHLPPPLLMAGAILLVALPDTGWTTPAQDPRRQTVPARTATPSTLSPGAMSVEPSTRPANSAAADGHSGTPALPQTDGWHTGRDSRSACRDLDRRKSRPVPDHSGWHTCARSLRQAPEDHRAVGGHQRTADTFRHGSVQRRIPCPGVSSCRDSGGRATSPYPRASWAGQSSPPSWCCGLASIWRRPSRTPYPRSSESAPRRRWSPPILVPPSRMRTC